MWPRLPSVYGELGWSNHQSSIVLPVSQPRYEFGAAGLNYLRQRFVPHQNFMFSISVSRAVLINALKLCYQLIKFPAVTSALVMTKFARLHNFVFSIFGFPETILIDVPIWVMIS